MLALGAIVTSVFAIRAFRSKLQRWARCRRRLAARPRSAAGHRPSTCSCGWSVLSCCPDGGFAYGGWHTPYFDDLSQQWVASGICAAWAFLFGHRTYEIFTAHWPRAADAEQALAEPLNTRPKYVASTTLTEPLGSANSILLNDEVTGALRGLKHRDGPDLHLIGSVQLAQTLLAHDLIDEMRLMIDPLMLGAGKRLFPASSMHRQLRLSDSQVATTGAILATYTRTP